MYHALLINPWIYDYAAVNMWARPLGLMKLAEYLSQYNIEITFIDCLDRIEKQKPYGMGKYPKTILPSPGFLCGIRRRYGRYGIGIKEFLNRLHCIQRPDIIFITGIMTYWYPGVFLAINLCKKAFPSVPVVLGGIYSTLFPQHAAQYSGADCIYQGRVDKRLVRQIEGFGIKLEKTREVVPYYKLKFYESEIYAPLLTSEGCPFRCSYCASSMLWNGFNQRSHEDVLEEIGFQMKKGIKDFAFYDDALLVERQKHIKPILRGIIEAGLKPRLHAPNGLHARYLDEELAFLMKRAGFVTVRLSLETVAPNRQKETGAKVFNEELISAVKNLKKAGFTKREIGVYLMYGLPGQGLDEVWQGVKFLKSLNVRIHLAEFSPLPMTQAWNELIENRVIPEDIDPILTNNTVFSLLYSGYKEEDVQALKCHVSEYNRI